MANRGDRQSQEAGAHSQQLQISGDVHIHQGVTEERAGEIAEANARAVLAEYTSEAQAVAARRIEEFDGRLIDVLQAVDRLGAFRDPAFQVLLRKAQIGAASTDRDSDFDILAGLLADRADRGDKRTVRASIDRAVEVVDLLDDEALNGLTVAMAVMQYTAMAGMVGEGLDTLDRLFGQLVQGDLPNDNEWLDHLDTLDAVRPSAGGFTIRPFAELYAMQMPGYVSVGFTAEEVPDILRQATLRAPRIQWTAAPHELKPEYYRFPSPGASSLRKTMAAHGTFATSEIDEIEQIARDVLKTDSPDGGLYERLGEEIDGRPILRHVRAWWDQIPSHFTITGVGRVLARANAQRHDKLGMLPPLE